MKPCANFAQPLCKKVFAKCATPKAGERVRKGTLGGLSLQPLTPLPQHTQGPCSDLHRKGPWGAAGHSNLMGRQRLSGKQASFVMEMRGEEEEGAADDSPLPLSIYPSSGSSACQLSHATGLSHSNQHMPALLAGWLAGPKPAPQAFSSRDPVCPKAC